MNSLANSNDWEILFHYELQQAELARSIGNEGKARVCARRAAGFIINEYFKQMGILTPGSGAYNAIRFLQTLPNVPDDVHKIADHFLERVDKNFTLPDDVDLIHDARWLAQRLLSQRQV
jgi:hypothetical protein